MKRYLIYLLILSMCFIGCAQPVGSFSKSSSSKNPGNNNSVDFWIIEVIERDYIVGDNFNRDSDYYITAFVNGDEVRVSANDPAVKTEINPNPESDVVMSREVTEQFFPFTEAGKHEVLVTYKGKTKSYRITVAGLADRNDPNINQGGLGGAIIWR